MPSKSVPVAVDAASRMAPEREVMLPWTYDVHRYPDQMALICRVEGVGLSSDVLAVGAFCGDECRGLGKVVQGRVMLTVHGEGDEWISFRVIDRATDELLPAAESTPFTSDVLGTYSAPFRLTLGNETTGIETIAADAPAAHTYYTLDGRRLNAVPAQKGIYMVNGQKYLVR